MLKMFHSSSAAAGGDAKYWEEAWSDGAFDAALRFCDVDPLKGLFERYVRPGDTMLEGGCGRANYVVHQQRRGVHAIGADFATTTLEEVRQRFPDTTLMASDVARLPLRDASIDAYYSGGVVEHFEGGPDDALAEAARVLKKHGAFLCSVPYFSPLRQVLSSKRVGRGDWQEVEGPTDAAWPRGRTFFQYAYRPKEFRSLLARHGFLVEEQLPYSILWGLYELPPLRRLAGGGMDTSGPPTAYVANAESTGAESPPPSPSLLKRLVVSEDRSVPILGLGVRALGTAAANMIMFACRRR